MNDSSQKPGDLADLISRLWRPQRNSVIDRLLDDTPQAACQETPNPVAKDPQRTVQTDKGTQEC